MHPNEPGHRYDSARLVDRQMRLKEIRERPCPGRRSRTFGAYCFVTLSRSIGSLGDAVAAELARRLDWHVYDREIVDHIARYSHVREGLVRQLDEKAKGLVEDSVRRLLGMAEGAALGVEDYHSALLHTLLFFATRGGAILVGRGANLALRNQPGLHLRIVGSPEVRVERLRQRWQVPAVDARRRMNQVDEERRQFVHYQFRKDVDDPRLYDVVYCSDFLTVHQIVDSILNVMNPSASTAAGAGETQGRVARPGSRPQRSAAG